ncbi:MAG: lysophospholipid acyltransferase family protein [Planctomycetota bacterium]
MSGVAAVESPIGEKLRRFLADVCVQHVLVGLMATTPPIARAARGALLGLTWRMSPYLRNNTLANARYLLGDGATPEACTRLARAIIANHYDFMADFARMSRWPLERLQGEIASMEGQSYYEQARSLGRGAVVVTAHLGSFEVGVAEIRRREEHVHVVFRRNSHAPFERLRSSQRARLGVHESPVDDGIANWLRLRDALRRNEVVLLQADRVMPPQAGARLPFAGGTLEVPLGPAKLAAVADAPIIPIFATHTPERTVQVRVCPPILPDADRDPLETTRLVTAVIESQVMAHPEQWLAAHSAPIHPPEASSP